MYTTTLANALAGPPTALSVVGGVVYCFAQFGSLDMSSSFAFGKMPSYLTCPVTTLLGTSAGAAAAAWTDRREPARSNTRQTTETHTVTSKKRCATANLLDKDTTSPSRRIASPP